MKYKQLIEKIEGVRTSYSTPSHSERTSNIHGWEVVKTSHGHDREQERHGGQLPGGHEEFIKKVIEKNKSFRNPKSGEYMYHSAKHNQAAVLNVDHEKKQLRVITVLPKGKTFPKPGTKKIMVESLGKEYDVIILD